MKRILIVYDDLPDGGSRTAIPYFFSELSKRTRVCFDLLTGINPQTKRYLSDFHFCSNVYTYPVTYGQSFRSAISVYRQTRQMLATLARTHTYDAVFSNYPVSGIAVNRSRIVSRQRIYHIFHNALHLDAMSWGTQTSLRERARIFATSLLQRWQFSYGTTLCFSPYAFQLAQAALRLSQPIRILPPFITNVPSASTVAIRRKKARKQLGIPKDCILFVVASRLEPRKGIHLVVRSVANFPKHTAIRIHILGETYRKSGDYLYTLFEQAKTDTGTENPIVFLPSVPQSEMDRHYEAADAVVMPSTDLETLGMVTLEAYSHGIPVIGLQRGATTDLVRIVDPALLVRNPDPKEFADKLLWFSTRSQQQRDIWTERIRTAMETHLDVKHTVRTFCTITASL